jgi:hypothetical protein
MSPMELIKKAFGIFKQKSAAPPKTADAPFEHDDNVVLVFGHSNAGKTVYFSVLYELLKGNDDFKLSPLNNETASNLIENYNLMRGKLLKIREGRQVEVEGERKFPTMTSETRILKFGIDLSMRKGLEFYTVDYKGETLAIAEPGQLRQQFAKFFPFARAALFFIDASVLDTDVLLREQIAAFQTILHDLRDCAPKRVPVGIVITKADFLEGFSASNPAELIPSGASIYKGRRKESFIRGLANVNRRRFGEVWAKSTERVSRTLGNLIDSISAYNLDFQFFFVSSTGALAKKPTGEIEPPRELRPVGVPDPLMWAFRRIMFNKRKAFWRYLTKWVIALCLMWIVGFSAINLYHQWILYDKLQKIETSRNDKLRPNPGGEPLPVANFDAIRNDYRDYLKRLLVSDFLGAQPIRLFVERRIKAIEDSKQQMLNLEAQRDAEQKKHPEIKREPPKPTYSAKTQTADAELAKIMEAIAQQPPADRQTWLTQQITDLLTKYAADSLDTAFITKANGRPEEYKKQVAAAQEQVFDIELVVENLAPKSQVAIIVGDQPEVEFSNRLGKTPSVTKEVQGKGFAPVKFIWRDLGDDKAIPLEWPVANPAVDFYPKLKDGYPLDFGVGKGIIVKLKSGQPPQWP